MEWHCNWWANRLVRGAVRYSHTCCRQLQTGCRWLNCGHTLLEFTIADFSWPPALCMQNVRWCSSWLAGPWTTAGRAATHLSSCVKHSACTVSVRDVAGVACAERGETLIQTTLPNYCRQPTTFVWPQPKLQACDNSDISQWSSASPFCHIRKQHACENPARLALAIAYPADFPSRAINMVFYFAFVSCIATILHCMQ